MNVANDEAYFIMRRLLVVDGVVMMWYDGGDGGGLFATMYCIVWSFKSKKTNWFFMNKLANHTHTHSHQLSFRINNEWFCTVELSLTSLKWQIAAVGSC